MNGEPVQSSNDRILGALIGLAVADAVGTTVEFKRPGTSCCTPVGVAVRE